MNGRKIEVVWRPAKEVTREDHINVDLVMIDCMRRRRLKKSAKFSLRLEMMELDYFLEHYMIKRYFHAYYYFIRVVLAYIPSYTPYPFVLLPT